MGSVYIVHTSLAPELQYTARKRRLSSVIGISVFSVTGFVLWMIFSDHAQFELEHDTSVLVALSSNAGSGESVHLHRLVRAFAACIHKVWM